MATYFNHGSSEIQAPDGGIHTLYLMNPNYVTPFSDETLHHHHHHHHQTQHLVGIPLTANAAGATGSNNSDEDDDPAAMSTTRPSTHQIPTAFYGTAAAAASRVPYSLWGGPMAGDSSGVAVDVAAASQMAFRRPPVVPVVTGPTQQGLSLSLSSHQTVYPSVSAEQHEFPMVAISRTMGVLPVGNSQSSSSGGGVQSVLLGSKYLKAVQEVLDEVINVGKEISKATNSSEIGTKQKMKMKRESESTPVNGGSSSGRGGSKQAAELTTAQRQELQMKKAKLVSMLDEVEHRYRQYHHQMQLVMSSFEQAAGFGSSKSYTALALQTISKQFKCLKDAISLQIKATGKNLGEDDEECLGAKLEGSRLRYVDHQLRQQRALQQLGMIQHNNNNNAWRPQRGLPERAVSVLRAWLFEHFLHPYPKDSDKVLLAKQTGLTRSQVSNWFINARVRLWKPMVEEMYVEETKDQEQKDDINPQQQDNNNKKNQAVNKKTSSSSNLQDYDQISMVRSLSTSPMGIHNNSQLLQSPSGLNLVGSKKQRSGSEISPTPTSSSILSMDMEYGKVMSETSERQRQRQRQTNKDNTYNSSLITVAAASEASTTGFGAYPNNNIGHNLGRFQASSEDQFPPRFHGNNNGFSLTLGLPHCDNNNLSLSGSQQSYLSNSNQNNIIHLGNIRRMEEIGTRSEADQFCAVNQPPHESSHQYSTAGFENMDMQNRKRFAAQLLPDFVT